MGLKDIILQKVLKVVDDTIGKKFKIIDQITDLFQGQEDRINKLEDRVEQMEREYENQYEKESRRNLDTKKQGKG